MAREGVLRESEFQHDLRQEMLALQSDVGNVDV